MGNRRGGTWWAGNTSHVPCLPIHATCTHLERVYLHVVQNPFLVLKVVETRGAFPRASRGSRAPLGVLRKVSVVYRQTVIGFSKCNKYSPPEVVSKSPRHACSNAPPAKSSPTAEMRNGWGAPGGAMWTTPSAMLRPTPPGVCRTRPGQVVPRVSDWPGNGDARTSITMPPTTTTAPDTEDGDVVSTRCATRRRAAAARIFWLTLTKTCGVLWGVPRSASC